MSTCERCWDDAYDRSQRLGGSQADHYSDLIRERDEDWPARAKCHAYNERRASENATPDRAAQVAASGRSASGDAGASSATSGEVGQ